MNALEKRIIELSYKNGLTHISSCLNCVNIISHIYDLRKENDPFVLGNCHASVAHYVVLEKHGLCDAQDMIEKHGVHASRDMKHGIWCSGGSLGQPETVAVGMAFALPEQTIWLVTSDGSCREGATIEALRESPSNMNIYVIFNGYGAYSKINQGDIPFGKYMMIRVDQNKYPEWLRGLQGHYLKLNHQQYEQLMR